MIVHALLIFLNKLRKRNKMRGLPSILFLFRNEFNKVNNKYRSPNVKFYLLQDIKKIFWKIAIFPYFTQSYNACHNVTLLTLLHSVISPSDATSCDKYFLKYKTGTLMDDVFQFAFHYTHTHTHIHTHTHTHTHKEGERERFIVYFATLSKHNAKPM